MRKIRIVLPLLAIFPYLVGFAPPDTAGTFVSLSVGHGVFPTASCSNHYINRYQEVALTLDRRVQVKKEGEGSWLKPRYTSFGVFGQLGSNQRIDVESSSSPADLSDVNAVGIHAGADWQWVGLDLGVFGNGISRMDTPVLPRAGVRIGPPIFYVSSSFAEGVPLYSDGSMFNMGLGTCFHNAQIWAGFGGPVDEGAKGMGIVRLQYRFDPVTLGLTLEKGSSETKYPMSENYGVAGGLEFRLP